MGGEMRSIEQLVVIFFQCGGSEWYHFVWIVKAEQNCWCSVVGRHRWLVIFVVFCVRGETTTIRFGRQRELQSGSLANKHGKCIFSGKSWQQQRRCQKLATNLCIGTALAVLAPPSQRRQWQKQNALCHIARHNSFFTHAQGGRARAHAIRQKTLAHLSVYGVACAPSQEFI